jgi:hypothetical protein
MKPSPHHWAKAPSASNHFVFTRVSSKLYGQQVLNSILFTIAAQPGDKRRIRLRATFLPAVGQAWLITNGTTFAYLQNLTALRFHPPSGPNHYLAIRLNRLHSLVSSTLNRTYALDLWIRGKLARWKI